MRETRIDERHVALATTLAAVLAAFGFGGVSAAQPFTVEGETSGEGLHWYKGNTHTHTLKSDGDSSAVDVVSWYRRRGYHFVSMTDHQRVLPVETLNDLLGIEGEFLVMTGEEVTSAVNRVPVHVNAINPMRVVQAAEGTDVLTVLQQNCDRVRAAGGVPQINHPNYHWALTPEIMAEVENCVLFELYNGHPGVNIFGGGGRPSTEELWDHLLSSGVRMYGMATDDSHVFTDGWAQDRPLPGRGWVMVRAPRLEPQAIVDALEAGTFYASTGVTLQDLVVDQDAMTITIDETGSRKYRVQFIGQGGKLLREDTSNPAVYRFRGHEGYVRSKVLESNGKIAWIQPAFVKPAANRISGQ